MTNKYMYFVANWKMYGNTKSVKTLKNVIKFSKFSKNKKLKIIYCPPNTLLNDFSKVFKNSKISLGAQNCFHEDGYGPYTGSISSKILKDIGVKYVLIGHSENRKLGETDILINKKIKTAINNNLKIILCIGESKSERRRKKTHHVLRRQIVNSLKDIKKLNNIFFAYEPIWSIGTGNILNINNLEKDIILIKDFIKKRYKSSSQIVLYGGSVNPKNINEIKKIKILNGFLIGGASQNSKKFIDIIKKSYI